MSRILTDTDLHDWEVYASGGPFGLPGKPKVVFNCLTDPSRRPRWVVLSGDNADAERAIREMDGRDLQRLFGDSVELR